MAFLFFSMEMMVSFHLFPLFLIPKTYLLPQIPSSLFTETIYQCAFNSIFSSFTAFSGFLFCIFDAHLFYWHLLIYNDLKSLSSLKLRNQKISAFSVIPDTLSYLHQKRIHVMFQHKDKLENTKSYFLCFLSPIKSEITLHSLTQQ